MFDTLMVFIIGFFSKKLILEKNQQTTQKQDKIPGGKEVIFFLKSSIFANQP